MACRGVGQSYPNLFLLFAVVFVVLFPFVVIAAYLDSRLRRRHLQRARQLEATIQEELLDKQQMLE